MHTPCTARITIGRLSLLIAVCAFWVPPAYADLVSHWTFDGHTEDTVGDNDGDFQGPDFEPVYVDGFDDTEEGAILFDGASLVIVQQNESLPLYNNPEFSIAMWVKGAPQPDYRVWSEGSTTSNSPLFNIGTQNGGTTGQVDLYIRDGNGATALGHTLSQGFAFDDRWHHIAWVDSGGLAELYIDGVRDPADFTYTRPELEVDTTTIGGILRAGPSHFFIGTIDDVRIYDHPLTEDEVLDLVPEFECPVDGDTHCGELTIEGPDDEGPGRYVASVVDAVDDSDDTIFYTFRAESAAGDVMEVGPQEASSASLVLSEGTWVVTVAVDDDFRCDDVADDSVCSDEIEVAGSEARMISHWTFDGDADDSVGGNNGNFEGFDLVLLDGFDGTEEGAILFDGVDDFVDIEQNEALPLHNLPEFSIAMWVRGGPQPDFRVWSEGSTRSNTPLFNIGTQNGGTTGQVDIYIRDATGATPHGHTLSTGVAFDHSWHHIVWVDANGDAALYIDGVRDATDFTYVKPALDLDTTTIGGIRRAGPSHFFSGAIDDVRVYNYILEDEEIQELAQGAICPEEGDTHCDDLIVEGPDDGGPGLYAVTVLDATDDNLDTILYTFTAENEEGELVEVGPQADMVANLSLGEGTWSVTVRVDDDPGCEDEAEDAVCSAEVVVLSGEPRMISHWPFDGETVDEVGENDGFFQGGAEIEPVFVEGFDGTEEGAVLFDGVDDLVVVEQNDSLPLHSLPEFSIAMWVKGGPQPDYRVWSEGSTVSNTPLFNIGTQNGGATGQVDLYIRDGGGTTALGHTLSTGEAFDDTWHHIAWVDANGQAALYIDGALDFTDFSYTKPALELDTTTIGGILRAAPSHFFNGAIDDVRIYNYVLTEDEILEIMEPGEEPGAVLKPGDVNGDGNYNLSDAVEHLGFLFGGGTVLPRCYVVPGSGELTTVGFAILDFNGDGLNNLSDPVGGLTWLFNSGPAHVLGENCVRLAGACETNCP